MSSTQRSKQPTPDARGRPKSSSSRQQTHHGQQTQTGSPELDGDSAQKPSETPPPKKKKKKKSKR